LPFSLMPAWNGQTASAFTSTHSSCEITQVELIKENNSQLVYASTLGH
jgi:hypothetical protein